MRKKNDLLTAIQLDMWLKEYMENKIVDGRMKTTKYPMIVYNLSCWFEDEKCYNEELKMANHGVDFCVKYGNLAAFPRLVLNKGVALTKLGDNDGAKKYLHQAITIFEAMQKNDTVQHIIAWCNKNCGFEI